MSTPEAITREGTRLFVADPENRRILAWDTIPEAGGAAASFALGQAGGSSNLTSATSGGGSPSVYSMVAVAGKLFAADNANNRVLVWNPIPTMGGQAASFALGQPAGANNLTSFDINAGGISASSMSFPTGVASDGTSLFVADTANYRVLGWSTIPSAPTPAQSVIGQPTFTAQAPNAGGAVSSASLTRPLGLVVEPTRLLIADGYNFRILLVPR